MTHVYAYRLAWIVRSEGVCAPAKLSMAVVTVGVASPLVSLVSVDDFGSHGVGDLIHDGAHW